MFSNLKLNRTSTNVLVFARSRLVRFKLDPGLSRVSVDGVAAPETKIRRVEFSKQNSQFDFSSCSLYVTFFFFLERWKRFTIGKWEIKLDKREKKNAKRKKKRTELESVYLFGSYTKLIVSRTKRDRGLTFEVVCRACVRSIGLHVLRSLS